MTDWLLHRLGLCCYRCCPYRHRWPPLPPAVRRIRLAFFHEGTRMRAQITATWTPSASTDVAKQVFVVTVNGTLGEPVELPASQSQQTFVVNDNSNVRVELYAVDADGFRSSSVFAEVVVPDLSAPLPPEALTLVFTPLP